MSTTTNPVAALHPAPASGTTSAWPTNKWLVAQVTDIGALVTMRLTTGGWDAEESVALVGLLVQAICTWIAPNADTPGGVPLKA